MALPPFGYVGGKSKTAKEIIESFPNHYAYIEVFAGALNILYRKPKSELEIVNDIDSDLINLHKTIKTKPQTLQTEIENLPISRELFYEIAKGKIQPRNDIQKAAFYYYLLKLSYASDLTYPSFSIYKNKRKKTNIYKEFKPQASRLKNVVIENLSYEKIIKKYDDPNNFFYLDPPYFKTKCYKNDFTKQDHENLAQILKQIKGKFALSYGDHPFIRELYKDYNIKEFKFSYAMSRVQANEILIMNYEPQGLNL